MAGLYVTGTDTGIGKTFASVCLMEALRARELRVVGMKPVASGCIETPDGLRSEDALALMAASSGAPAYADVNPIALKEPQAPQIAALAAAEPSEPTLEPIQSAFAALAANADVVVLEGVGGWAAPLSATFDQADIVRALDLPVLLVVGLRLGCISHARLTARAIAADSCRLVGWVGNELEADMPRRDEVMELLQARLQVPCWGLLPHAPEPGARGLQLPEDWP